MARPGRNQNEYLGPVIFSICLHVGIAILALISWPTLSKPDPVQPHITAVIVDDAMLEQMKQSLPKPKPAEVKKPEPAEVDTRKQMEEAKRKIDEARKAEEARKAAVEKKKQEAIALKKKQEEEKKKKVEQEKQAEAKRLEEQRKAEQKKKQEQKRKEEQRLAEEKRRQEELKRKEEEERKALEQKLIEERERARKEKEQQEELALQQQAVELERMLQEQAQQESAAKQKQRDLTELEKYRSRIQQVIERSWLEPPGNSAGLVVQIELQLLPTGELLSAKIVEPSSNPAFDQSAISAAYAVKRYPVPENSRLFNENFRTFILKFNPR
ncbi:cell envelope integrity protein TolA [Hahella ganghwensis]|uniref:cell envelope integrity protein TolA n=1 Tax=Hahella ganghwensis TaxID=286420 RepID=UPI00035E04A6|nr:cell envelope integrity protein TolA [Hahella ganghwensis]